MQDDVIRVKGLFGTGTWEQLGVDRYPGREPQGISYNFNSWGPDSLTFSIQRDPALLHPDLEEFTPVEVMQGERIVWSGFIIETPAGQDRVLSVSCRGWQYHLDDDVYTDIYVHGDMSKYTDMRQSPNALLGNSNLYSGGQVQSGDGTLSVTFPEGSLYSNGAHAAAVLDLGPGNVGRKVLFQAIVEPAAGGDEFEVLIRGSTKADNRTSSGGGWASGNFTTAFQDAIDSGWNVGVQTATIGSGYRYIHIIVRATVRDSPTTPSVWDAGVTFSTLKVAEQTSYLSSSASVLTANTVIADAISRAPLLDQSTSKISTTSFTIPHYAFEDEERTPRQVMEDMNAYHRYVLRVTPNRVVEFKPQTNSTRIRVDTNTPGVAWQDASVSSGTDMYSRVIGRGTQGDGEAIKYTTSTAVNAISKRGFNRTKVFDVQFPIDPAALQQICDVYLSLNSRSVLKGSLEIRADGAVRGSDQFGVERGIPIGMSELGQYVGENITIANLIDPDTGALGRVGTIAAVQMNADSVTLTLDNQRSHFEALLSRMGVVTNRP